MLIWLHVLNILSPIIVPQEMELNKCKIVLFLSRNEEVKLYVYSRYLRLDIHDIDDR